MFIFSLLLLTLTQILVGFLGFCFGVAVGDKPTISYLRVGRIMLETLNLGNKHRKILVSKNTLYSARTV